MKKLSLCTLLLTSQAVCVLCRFTKEQTHKNHWFRNLTTAFTLFFDSLKWFMSIIVGNQTTLVTLYGFDSLKRTSSRVICVVTSWTALIELCDLDSLKRSYKSNLFSSQTSASNYTLCATELVVMFSFVCFFNQNGSLFFINEFREHIQTL